MILNIYGYFTAHIRNQHLCFAKEESNCFIFAAVILETKSYNDGEKSRRKFFLFQLPLKYKGIFHIISSVQVEKSLKYLKIMLFCYF